MLVYIVSNPKIVSLNVIFEISFLDKRYKLFSLSLSGYNLGEHKFLTLSTVYEV